MADRRAASRTGATVATVATVAAIVLAVAPAGSLAAQDAPSTVGAPPASPGLVPGRRVRVHLRIYRDHIDGVIDSVLPAAFVLDTAARAAALPFMARGPELLARYRTIRIGYDEIERLEVSAGRSRSRGMLLWSTAGGAAGALLGGVNRDDGAFGDDARRGSFASRALPGAIAGAVLGGTFGWFTGRERWAPADWP